MKTRIEKNGESVTVALSGCLDFEAAAPFKENLEKLLTSNAEVKFDLTNLSFVGSCGITAFVQTLRDFNTRSQTPPVYMNVKSEFRRIITAFDLEQSFQFTDSLAPQKSKATN